MSFVLIAHTDELFSVMLGDGAIYKDSDVGGT